MTSSVRKSLSDRHEELRKSITVIEHNLTAAMEQREVAFMYPVVSEMRALLASSGHVPLLLDLAEISGFPLEFYSIQLDFLDNEEIAKILGPTRIQWTGDSMSTTKNEWYSQKVTMAQWLGSTQLVVWGRKYTGEELIKAIADKYVVHKDVMVPTEIAEIQQFHTNGTPTHFVTLARLGAIVVHLGRGLMEHTTSQGKN